MMQNKVGAKQKLFRAFGCNNGAPAVALSLFGAVIIFWRSHILPLALIFMLIIDELCNN
jgi:hypothetical protein